MTTPIWHPHRLDYLAEADPQSHRHLNNAYDALNNDGDHQHLRRCLDQLAAALDDNAQQTLRQRVPFVDADQDQWFT